MQSMPLGRQKQYSFEVLFPLHFSIWLNHLTPDHFLPMLLQMLQVSETHLICSHFSYFSPPTLLPAHINTFHFDTFLYTPVFSSSMTPMERNDTLKCIGAKQSRGRGTSKPNNPHHHSARKQKSWAAG